jgi:hypothetical protein
MPRLKVFRTTSGIHDHVVAAPSRPAALKAWGARTDLFSMGVAEEVTDAKIKKKAFAHPGEVISISRSGEAGAKVVEKRKSPKKRRAPKPSRKKLGAAEQRLEQLSAKQQFEMSEIDRELQTVQRRREQLERRHGRARAEAEEKLEIARADYEAALDQWSPDG